MVEQEQSPTAEYADWQAPETGADAEVVPSRFSVISQKMEDARGSLMLKLQEKFAEDRDDDPARSFAKEDIKESNKEVVEQALNSFKDLFTAVKVEKNLDYSLTTNAVHDGGGLGGSAVIASLVASRVAKSVGRFLSR